MLNMKAILCVVFILFNNLFPVNCEVSIPFLNDHHEQGHYGAGYDHPDNNHHHGYHKQGLHGSSGFYADHGHKRHQPEHIGSHYGHDLLDKRSHGHETLKENSHWNRNRGEVFIKKASWDQDEGRRNHLVDAGHHDGYHSNHGHGGKYISHGGVDEGYSRKGGHLLLKAFNEGGYNKGRQSYNKYPHIPLVKHLPSLPLVPIHEPQYNLIKHNPLVHEKIAFLKPLLDYRPQVAYIDDEPYHNYDKHLPRPDPVVYTKPYIKHYGPGYYQKHDNYHNEHLPVYRDNHQIKPLSHLLPVHGYLDHMPKYREKVEYREPPIGYDNHPPRHHSYHEQPEYHGHHNQKPHVLPIYHEKPVLLHKPDIYIPGVPDVIPDIKTGLGDIYPLGSVNQGQKQ